MKNSQYDTIPDAPEPSDTTQLLADESGAKITLPDPSIGNVGAGGISTEKILLGAGYMLAMGVCGIVLVALGSTLGDLADNIGLTSTQIGTVFIARGVGAVFGAIFSAKLYLWYQGNYVMTFSLLGISIVLSILPFNESFIGLHIYFFLLGLGTAITDTGCQIMTRKVHGKAAGPWLGANTVAFGISGALVPVIEIFTTNLIIQFFIMMGMVIAVGGLIFFGPNPEKNGRLTGPPKKDGVSASPHYYVEMVIGFMVFCFIGGKVTSTAYLGTYVDETGVIDAASEPTLILVLWIAITIGRLAGVQDQMFMTNKTLPVHLSILCVGGFLSMLLVIWFPDNSQALWIGVAFYGLFNGPCVGYCYDWNNRITLPNEKSMSIVMFGLNFGASLVPYVTTLIWDHGGGPRTLIIVICCSMIVPLPLLHLTKYISYDTTVNPRLKNSYSAIPQEESNKGHD